MTWVSRAVMPGWKENVGRSGELEGVGDDSLSFAGWAEC